MTGITHHPAMIQGSEEWIAARCGMLTASEMARIITPSTLKPARNDNASAHLYELLAQRITRYVEPHYISDDMMRGTLDETDAKMLYDKHFWPVKECGFIVNDTFGFPIGYSPDGLVGVNGLIEIKSRRQKFQAETIISGVMPDEYRIQVQTALAVSGRDWCDFVSYCGGMPMVVIRVYPDEEVIAAIIAAATDFEERLVDLGNAYHNALREGRRYVETERRIEQEMFV